LLKPYISWLSCQQKKGGLAREEEDIEYIALASIPALPPRVVWKQSKIDTEEDEDMVGQSPKLILPKPRLRGGAYVRVTTDWTDLHVYVLSPWLLTCIRERHLLSLQSDGIPLWVSRQFQGVSKTFGNGVKDGVMEQVLSSFQKGNSYTTPNVSTEEYAVRAHVLDGWKALRACTVPSYLFACREVVTRAVEDVDDTSNLCVAFPPNTTINARSQTIVLEDATLGEKVTIKSSTIGRFSKISAKCRLNNVVLMDKVVVKENCVLQNSILGKGCTIGENCNLNDCQVAPGKVVPAGTKEKGESLMDATLV
jgi:translation initiation factor eIF-2B subunit gamma